MPVALQSWEGLRELVARAVAHPKLAGLAFLWLGLVFSAHPIYEGMQLEPFLDGARVEGTVVELRGNPRPPRWYAMTASWTDETGSLRSASMKLWPYEFHQLKPGDAIELVVSRDDPSKAAVALHVEFEAPIRLGGFAATKGIFTGLGLALLGLVWAASWTVAGLAKRASAESRQFG